MNRPEVSEKTRARLDAAIHSFVLATLSLGIVGVAAYQTIISRNVDGPFQEWAALIIGVYFGVKLKSEFNGGK